MYAHTYVNVYVKSSCKLHILALEKMKWSFLSVQQGQKLQNILCSLNMVFNPGLVFSYASYVLQFVKSSVQVISEFKCLCFGINI